MDGRTAVGYLGMLLDVCVDAANGWSYMYVHVAIHVQVVVQLGQCAIYGGLGAFLITAVIDSGGR